MTILNFFMQALSAGAKQDREGRLELDNDTLMRMDGLQQAQDFFDRSNRAATMHMWHDHADPFGRGDDFINKGGL